MKRFVITFSLCIGLCLFLSAQEQAVAKIHYIFKHVNDTTQKDKYLRDEVVVYLAPSSSYYNSYSSTRAQEAMKKQLDDPAFNGNLVISRNTTPIKASYLFDFANQTTQVVRQVGGDHFLLDIPFPAQDWKVENESKTIGGYEAQKATTSFKGREYTAWFTTELPFSAGPWKLNGLPGLILEAYDRDKEVVFEYSGFDKLEDVEFFVAVPENTLKSTEKEIDKLAEAFKANPQAYMQSKRGSTVTSIPGGTMTRVVRGKSTGLRTPPSGNTTAIDAGKIKSINVKNDNNYAPSKDTNNPIELIP